MSKMLKTFSVTFLLLMIVAITALGQTVPPPPTQRADRFGVYFWNPDFSGWPGSPDRLTWGREHVAETGTRTIRVFLGDPTYNCVSSTTGPYGVNPYPNQDDALYLVRIAQTTAYRNLFNDPRFSTYMLTVYTTGATLDHWRDGFTEAESLYERTRIFELGQHLINNYNKKFIILNWEGDHPFPERAATAELLAAGRNGFVDWIKAMDTGVEAARNNNPGAPGTIYSGLELNCLANSQGPCPEDPQDPK